MITRSLKHELHFHCCDDEIYRGLQFVGATPDMPTADLIPIEVMVFREGNSYSLKHGSVDVTGSITDIVDASHALVREILLAELGSGLLLHAASFCVNDQNIVMFAEKCAGKTTLALKLLESGYTVFGDEHVVISRTNVFPRPRTLRVKQSSIALVPDLATFIEASPAYECWDGSTIYSVTPRTNAVSWQLAPFAVDHFIHLIANHGARTHLSQTGTKETFEVAMQQCFLPDSHRGAGLAALYEAVSRANCWQMKIGDIDEAVGFLRRIRSPDSPPENYLNNPVS